MCKIHAIVLKINTKDLSLFFSCKNLLIVDLVRAEKMVLLLRHIKIWTSCCL